MIVLQPRKTLVRLNPASTLTLIMHFHLHLCAESLMLTMWPLGQHQHHLHHGHALHHGAASVCGSIARPSTPVHSDMVRDDLHDLAMVLEYWPQVYQSRPGLTGWQRAEDLPLLLSQALSHVAGGSTGQAQA